MRGWFFGAVIAWVLAPCGAWAQNHDAINVQFADWLETDLWPRAQAVAVSRATFDAAFDGVRPNLDLPDLVIPGASEPDAGAQFQAEFRAPAAYFDAANIAAIVTIGREKAATHAAQLARLEAETGVPGPILLAIWGRESAFGRAEIPHDALAVLGTKAFIGRRSAFFTDEVLAALQVVQTTGIAPRDLRSSWAGALGQPQFLPSSLLTYGRDGDGNGRIDIWGSEADTLASIAAFLAVHGWQRGRGWGAEVTLPPSVSCTLEGPDQGRPGAEWSAMGIATADPGAAFLMVPAGRFGPAFLVSPNFYVLKEYNTSDLYALWVGDVANRIAGEPGGFSAPWAAIDTMQRGEVAQMQAALQATGLDTGGADGLVGFRTRRAIGQWQAAQGVAPTCFPDASVIGRLAN